MKHPKLFFICTVLAFAIVQQLGRPKNCTLCEINNALQSPSPQPYQLPTQLVTISSAVTSVITSVIMVHGDAELRTALADLQPGSTLKIAPGEYRGGQSVRGVEGLTIEAADPEHPPTFQGGGNAWHFSACSKLTVRNIVCVGQTGNGINIDDGGREESTAYVTLENLSIKEVGPKGNHDGIKLSGIDHVTISKCQITGWGGQGIDMVGCHHGVIKQCRFEGQPGFSASAGVQTKGGSSDILIEDCDFKDAGERPLNIGGSTGLDYFRPKHARYEAARIVARGNRIEGALCAVAFVGVDGAQFTGNTILYPKKWVFRILQETGGERFTPCRNVKIENNRIAFRRADVQVECNVGGGTEATSFEFRGNHWFAADRPDRSQPRLPVAEIDGHYGDDWTQNHFGNR